MTITADLLALPDPTTALCCGNDWMAMGASEAVREAGLRIPKDVAIVGFDNRVEIADHMRPLSQHNCPALRRDGEPSCRGPARPATVRRTATELIKCPFVQRSLVFQRT